MSSAAVRNAISLVHRLASRMGLVVHRWPGNRFDAMADALRLLAMNGFRGDVVIDVGANQGQWTQLAQAVFPTGVFHLIGPQAGCLPALRAMAAADSRIHLHDLAVTRPGVSYVRMIGGGSGTNPGSSVVPDGQATLDAIEVRATTLDSLFADRLGSASRVLLKMDVESHELEVLAGAERLLERCEVVVSEFRLFVDDPAYPTLRDLEAWLKTRGFVLYDFAALRPRARDRRLMFGDVVFVRATSPLVSDSNWD